MTSALKTRPACSSSPVGSRERECSCQFFCARRRPPRRIAAPFQCSSARTPAPRCHPSRSASCSARVPHSIAALLCSSTDHPPLRDVAVSHRQRVAGRSPLEQVKRLSQGRSAPPLGRASGEKQQPRQRPERISLAAPVPELAADLDRRLLGVDRLLELRGQVALLGAPLEQDGSFARRHAALRDATLGRTVPRPRGAPQRRPPVPRPGVPKEALPRRHPRARRDERAVLRLVRPFAVRQGIDSARW